MSLCLLFCVSPPCFPNFPVFQKLDCGYLWQHRITSTGLVAELKKQTSSFPFRMKMKTVLSMCFLELEVHEQWLRLQAGAYNLTEHNFIYLLIFCILIILFIPSLSLSLSLCLFFFPLLFFGHENIPSTKVCVGIWYSLFVNYKAISRKSLIDLKRYIHLNSKKILSDKNEE